MKAEHGHTDWHFAYMDMLRHWHPGSERYTGGDALFTALEAGWDMSEVVRYEEYWHLGVRSVLVYYFELTRDGETLIMPVIRNPYVNRIVREMPATLVQVEPSSDARSRFRPNNQV